MAGLPQLPTTSGDAATPGSTGSTSSASRSAASSTATGDSSSDSASTTASRTSSGTSNGADSVITGAPALSSDGPGLSLSNGLPTLSGHYSYPPPTVPATQNAPYMQSSALPQNFVFIVVGACLAFIALIILAWRFLTAWSINRNFKRDTTAYTPLTDVKKRPTKNESSHDLADLSAKLPSSFNSVPNLFFSPTAEVARQSMVRPASQHMPAGHYRDASR